MLDSGVAMVGIATALALEPALPRQWREGQATAPMLLQPITWKNKGLAAAAHMGAVKYQLSRLSQQRPPHPGVSPVWALLTSQVSALWHARTYRQWMLKRSAGG